MKNINTILTSDQISEHKEYIKKMVMKIAFRQPFLTVPEYAEKYINIPIGPKIGPFSLKSFPPIEEILYHTGPQSNKNYIFIMASIQTVKTTVLDIASCYWLDHFPQDILYVSATERMGKKWRVRRLGPMINSSGIRDRRFVGAFVENKKSRRTGETTFQLEVEGKILDIGTANSAASLSSDTKRILFADEVSRWPDDVGKEGHPLTVAIGRTTAWDRMAKVVAVSSPIIEGADKMQELFNSGDKRYYHATCPFCGKRQPLERGGPETRHGLRWETKAGHIDYESIYYLCDFCGEAIKEHQKHGMLQKKQPRPIKYPEREPEGPGWVDTKAPDDPWIVSYQIGALYSPFFSWSKYVSEYEKASVLQEKLQTFINQRDGLPFKIQGFKPELEGVIELRGSYLQGQIPQEVLFLTAFIDVQHGQEGWETDDSKKKPRLELGIIGHGDGYRTFAILYKVFSGSLDDIEAGAWEKFKNFVKEGGFIYSSADLNFSVKLALIDAGSVRYNDQIYSFCREMGTAVFCPSMGFNILKRKKSEISGKIQEDTLSSRRDYDRYRIKRDGDIIIYEISTYIYKVALFTRLQTSSTWKKEKPGERTPAGYCGFPADFPESFFDGLLSEEHLPDKMKFIKPDTRKPNEPLDIVVGNLAAGEIYLYIQTALLRVKFQAMKIPANFIASISAKFIIQIMKMQKSKKRSLTTAEIRNELRLSEQEYQKKE